MSDEISRRSDLTRSLYRRRGEISVETNMDAAVLLHEVYPCDCVGFHLATLGVNARSSLCDRRFRLCSRFDEGISPSKLMLGLCPDLLAWRGWLSCNGGIKRDFQNASLIRPKVDSFGWDVARFTTHLYFGLLQSLNEEENRLTL